jgi:hypothetical protein
MSSLFELGKNFKNIFLQMRSNQLACPAGVEPATYGLEGLKNLDKKCLTMTYDG